MTNTSVNSSFEELLEYLKHSRGFDFAGYKRASLMRRIQKRMQMVNITEFADYMDYLEVHSEEFERLFNMILINVTGFFRDPPTWDYVVSDVLPRLITQKHPYGPIRIWSAGCASGEEAYTLAMVMTEALSVEEFRERVKIYATDIDEEALSYARQGVYTAREVINIPEPLLTKYFESDDNHYTFRKDLRRSLIFGRHDLLRDAPISRIDLLVCRNTIMYFNAEAQAKVLSRFHFALSPNGYLYLGKAEMLLTHSDLFIPVDLKRRIFTKTPSVNLHTRLQSSQPVNGDGAMAEQAKHMRFRDVAFEVNPIAELIVDTSRSLLVANERARTLFALTNKDIGRSIYDFAFSYQLSEFRVRLEDAFASRRSINLAPITWNITLKEVRDLSIQLTPLLDIAAGVMMGVSVTFQDITASQHLRKALEHTNQELETSYEELQSTNEELETTNEELQSTNEELETTNEELQSTNEEFETINEELQSTNEELHTLNSELHQRTEELHRVNVYTEAILTSMQSAVVVLNGDLNVQVWSRHAEELWGLRTAEVKGKNFLGLDIGLPVEQLKQSIRTVLNKTTEYQEMIMTATNRRGKSITCRVTCGALHDTANRTTGVILLMGVNFNSRTCLIRQRLC